MAVNRDKPDQWKKDIDQSIARYNDWFMQVESQVFNDDRIQTRRRVEQVFALTGNLKQLNSHFLIHLLIDHPGLLPMLRMATCPPMTRERLIKLSQANPQLIQSMENYRRIPREMKGFDVEIELEKVANVIRRMADFNILTWLSPFSSLSSPELDHADRAITIMTERWCSLNTDRPLRQALQERQLNSIASWLEFEGYSRLTSSKDAMPVTMPPGTYRFNQSVPVKQGKTEETAISIDIIIHPKVGMLWSFPLLINVKSSDSATVKKERKEVAEKVAKLREIFGREDRIK